jgi:hypothetical protein
MDKKAKLRDLAEEWGCSSPEELLRRYAISETVPGICTNPSCSFAAEYEPDQREGFCEECETQTVASAFVLAELI